MERIEIAGVDPQQVARAAAAIRAGVPVVLPTETVYGLAIDPAQPQALAQARALKERPQERVFTFHLADAHDAETLAVLPARLQRLVQRFWPGPLTIVVPGRDGHDVGLRVPAHEFTRAVIRAVGHPLFLTSVNRSGEPPLDDPARIATEFGDRIALLCDAGPAQLGQASTVVRMTGPEVEILREGILDAATVERLTAQTVLFVCTGNTCRSPLAEGLARMHVAAALGIPPERLAARGLRIVSAGVTTYDGMPASEGAVAAGAELGLDLGGHRSRSLDSVTVADAVRIYALAESHVERLLAAFPEAAGRVELLAPDGVGIGDPFGGPLPAYRAARDEIERAVRARVPQWLKLMERG